MDIFELMYRASWTALTIGGGLVLAALTWGIFTWVGVDR